jgi:hypothetical protein
MSEEKSGGVTVVYGSKGTAVNFPKGRYISVDAQGVLTLSMDLNNVVAVFPSGGWHRVFNLNVDEPTVVASPDSQ